MGLDMFLLKRKKSRKSAAKYFDDISYEQWGKSKVAYWRKSNQIHKWFVDTIQDGNDDCGYYKVSKEQLMGLKELCKTLLDEIILEEGNVINGYTIEDGHKLPIVEKGKIITNPEICEDMLPTQSGFFFGSTDYDEYYYDDIKYTYDTLCKILIETDFDKEEIFYTSSW